MNHSPLRIFESRGVRLVPNGADRYRCACPIHNGDALSMSVSLRNDRWQITCFACGFAGTTPNLLVALTGCTIAQAFRDLEGDSPTEDDCPVDLHPRDYFALICDRCGDARKVEGQTYKVPGKQGPLWESTPLEEVFAATSHGWEISARAEFALCPECLS